MSDTLSVAEAVEQLNAPFTPEADVAEAPQAGADTATPEASNQEIAQDDPDLEIDDEDAAEGPSGSDVEDEEGEEATHGSPIQAPEFWSADYKARFAKLSAEAQQLIVDQAKPASDAVAKAINENVTARKAAEQEAQAFAQQRAELAKIIEPARKDFLSRWGGATPEVWKVAYQQDPMAAAQAEAQMKAEFAEMQALEQAQARASAQERATYFAAERQALTTLAEKDPIAKRLMGEGAQARLDATKSYVVSQGIPADRADDIGASELIIAHKAMLYDQARAKQAAAGKAQATHQPQAQAGARMRAPAKPATSQQVTSIEKQSRRLSQTHSLDDAVALLNMREHARLNGR